MPNKKRNKGIAIQRIREALAKGERIVSSVSLSDSTEQKVAKSMAELVKKSDSSLIISYPNPFERIALSLAEQEGFTTIEVRHFEGVKIYVIERILN